MKNYGVIFRNTFFLMLILSAFAAHPVQALQVVYPKTLNTQVCAASTFFIGSTEPGSSLKINDKDVKVYDNGSFVEVVPLSDGDNTVKIESSKDNKTDTLSYIIKRIPKTDLVTAEPATEEFAPEQYIYASVINDNTPLRAQPDENAKRITHLNHNTILMINGKKGAYYRVSLSPAVNAWVKAENVVNYSTINGKMLASASNVTVSEDKLYTYIKTDLSFPSPYRIVETDTGLTMELYNIKENTADSQLYNSLGAVKTLAVNTVCADSLSTYYVELNQKLWGYTAYYDGNTLVLKIRKAPVINEKNPLKGLTIAIDAGHGGDDAGAIGPTGVKEKEINLDVSKKLKKLLEQEGAEVVMTRDSDCCVPLYDRPVKAQEKDSLIMISIHANALADGADPYKKHGTSVFYYNRESVQLAKTLRDVLTQELGTKDDGVAMYSLVMTRPTMPLSVLVEVAYMIHPDEYKLLLDENFRQKAAEALKKGIETYLLKTLQE